MVLLDGREVGGGGMDGNTVVVLLVGRAELEKDTIAATGRESRGWDGWEHRGAGGGKSGAGYGYGAWCCWTGERWMGWMRTWLRCWRGERSWIEIRCVVLLDGKEVDGLGG